MHYHIILTEICNLKCKYCYEKSMNEFDNGLEEKFDYDMETPIHSEVEIEKLKKFLKPTDTLIFYGGEPLMKINKIIEIMDNINCRFEIQTNGLLLDQLPTKYLLHLEKMLVSIDGTKERDSWGKGNFHYDKIIKNVKNIRERGFKNEIVARMVISKSDIFTQVMHLINLVEDGLFDSIHWQIDAGFYKFDFNEEEFSKFVERYNEEITQLIFWWIEELRRGKTWKLYPFIGIVNRLLGWDNETRLPCGSGHSNFTINTKGMLSACPIMNSVKNLYCGSIENSGIKEINIDNPECISCEEFPICGGRCLYWKKAKLWPKQGDELICKTIKHLIKLLRTEIPEIKKLLQKKIITKEDFEYEKYFGPEIIP